MIAEQISDLKQKTLELVREQKMEANFQQRIEDMDDCLKRISCEVREFDDDLVRLVQSVKVINNDFIEIQFKSVIVMKQRIPYCE